MTGSRPPGLVWARRGGPTPATGLRPRVLIRHSLARIRQIEKNKARYCGVRKDLYDVRRTAVVANRFAVRGAVFADVRVATFRSALWVATRWRPATS